jgi:hypothetical protein
MEAKLFVVYYGVAARMPDNPDNMLVLVAPDAEGARIKAKPIISTIAPWTVIGKVLEARYVQTSGKARVASAGAVNDRNDLENPPEGFEQIGHDQLNLEP